jgi:hypothetical protein
MLSLCIAASSCGADVSALENLCFAMEDFDLERAGKYVGDEEGYFARGKDFAEELDSEKAEIAKAIYSNMDFSDFTENEGVCVLTVKYVDFEKLRMDVNLKVNTGASATDVLRELLESKGFAAKYIKMAENVTVTLSKDGGAVCVPLGYASVNSEFTKMLGLDTFLGWFILQM